MEGTHWVVEEITEAGDWNALDAATVERLCHAEALWFARKQDAEAWMITLIDDGFAAYLLRVAEHPNT